MIYLQSPSNDAQFNLALEQFVFEEMDRNQEYFMLWQNANAIIVGKNRTLPIIEGLKEAGFPAENIHRVDSLDDSTKLLHSMVRPTDTVLYENDLPDHYQEA